MTDPTVLAAMVAVESAWLQALLGRGVMPPVAGHTDLGELVTAADCDSLARAAEDGGSPVMALVAMLRQRARRHRCARSATRSWRDASSKSPTRPTWYRPRNPNG
jgi:adenylosuccinate lyase